MTLTGGTRLGQYEILEALGAGGMGEVYRALDTQLDRHVALKVVPETIDFDGERLDRFTREAHMVASLNHPNIAAIYGLESSSGVRALVLELVDGPTLAERMEGGAIPWREALPIARQIALALEAAHERAIVHRDLKPANVKMTPEGTIKVLDFGLAKAVETPGLKAGPTDVVNGNSPTDVGARRRDVPRRRRHVRGRRRTRDLPVAGVRAHWRLSGRRAFSGGGGRRPAASAGDCRGAQLARPTVHPLTPHFKATQRGGVL